MKTKLDYRLHFFLRRMIHKKPSPAEKVSAMHSSRSEADTDRGDTEQFCKMKYGATIITQRAIRESPLLGFNGIFHPLLRIFATVSIFLLTHLTKAGIGDILKLQRLEKRINGQYKTQQNQSTKRALIGYLCAFLIHSERGGKKMTNNNINANQRTMPMLLRKYWQTDK